MRVEHAEQGSRLSKKGRRHQGGMVTARFWMLGLVIAALTVVCAGAPARAAVFTFSNSSFIAINDNAAATPYPSNITVSGVTGAVTHVTVRLFNLSHSFPGDIDALLVSPSNLNAVMLMSDAGGGLAVSNANLTFDDCAVRLLPSGGGGSPAQGIVSGRFRPSNYGFGASTDIMPAPAPAEPYGTALAVFNGLNGTFLNGTWSLYVRDDAAGDLGSIGGGWSITIFTDSSVPGNTLPLAQQLTNLNPVPCGKPDFDGDGLADISLFRDGAWYILRSSDDGVTGQAFGGPGDVPVPADYDGDGLTDLAVFRGGVWFIRRSSDG